MPLLPLFPESNLYMASFFLFPLLCNCFVYDRLPFYGTVMIYIVDDVTSNSFRGILLWIMASGRTHEGRGWYNFYTFGRK